MKRLAIHSPPRSGSTWLGAIFDSHPSVIYKHQPLFSYTFKDYLGFESTQEDIKTFFHELASTQDDFLDRTKQKEEGVFPQFEKTSTEAVVYKEVRYHHLLAYLLATDPQLRVIGLLRNPVGTIHSWLSIPKEFDPSWDSLKQWEYAPKRNQGRPEEYFGYQKWKEVAWMFQYLSQAYPDRFVSITYEALNDAPKDIAQALFSFGGLEWNMQTEDFLSQSTSTASEATYGVYRKKKKSYRHADRLQPEIKQAILEDPEFEILCSIYNWDLEALE